MISNHRWYVNWSIPLVFYFQRHAMVVVDHIAIKEPARNFGAFFKFKAMITQHLVEQKLQIDYVLAEIVTSKQGDPHPVESQLLIQLLKQQGFKVAHLPYYTPSIREDEYKSKIEAALMIWRNDRGNKISSVQLSSLLDCILVDLYIRWYTPHSRNLRGFRKQIGDLRKLYKKEMAGQSFVELNGNWAQPHVQPKEGGGDGRGGGERASFAVTTGLMLVLVTTVVLLAGTSYYFNMKISGVVLVFVAALFALLAILAIWHKSAATQLDKVVKLLGMLLRGNKKIG